MSEELEALYPFLSPDGAARPAVSDLLRSAESKIAESTVLRERCLQQYGVPLARCAAAVAERLARGGKLLAFGNGGSSTDADALVRLFTQPPAGALPLPAQSLSADVAVITALANDVGFDVVYARQLATLAHDADVAIGLSTSGNSANVIRAFDEARRRGVLTVGFAGNGGGQMADASLDFLFVVPSSSVHRIQEAQTTLYHALWQETQRELVPAT